MANHTNIKFRILPFSSNTNNKHLIVGIFSTLYLMVIILNSAVIAVICLDAHLHTPLYLFFCNLSVIDICYTTVVIPKLLHILLSGNDLLSFTQCFTQIYFFFIAAGAEVMVLFVMGYDRYVAICLPLHYNQILSMRNTTLIIVILWICAFINPSFFINSLLKLTFDPVVSLHQFFCDSVYVFNTSDGGSEEFYIVICIECVVFGLCPFFCNLVSYIKIFGVILRIKTREGKKKTFSTCLSHLIVMMIYYTTGLSQVISSLHRTESYLNQILSVFYTTVVPMINPLVYSLRNNEIKKALQRWMKVNEL